MLSEVTGSSSRLGRCPTKHIDAWVKADLIYLQSRCSTSVLTDQDQAKHIVIMDSSAQKGGALAAALAGASAADLGRGMSSISPAEQMAIVEAAQRAARESDGGMLIARNHSSDEATVGSWVSSMEAVWGGLAALEARTKQQAAAKAAEGQQESGGGDAVPLAAAVSGAAGPAAGSSSAQQEQVASAAEQQLQQPAVATKAS